MKKYNFIIMAFILSFISCNESEWLKEQPLSIFTTDNAFITPEDFESANARIYDLIRDNIHQANQNFPALWYCGTDIGLRNGNGVYNTHFNSYVNLIPTMSEVSFLWNFCYEVISSANVIIGRVDNPNIAFNSEKERLNIKAQAVFFRAFGYRLLVHIYGGVPIVLKEISSAKRDFKRATKEETVTQIIADLEFAAENLPAVGELKADGYLCNAAAYHLLSEMYITASNPDKAIAAASKVIDNPDFKLMTERFGSRKNEAGDVYWDLFRKGNQNRQKGLNKEAIWVSQYEYQVEGGGTSNQCERFVGPQYYIIQGPDGKGLFVGPTAQNGGRGISWTGLTEYGDTLIWLNDWDNDIRNSNYNILRDMIADNPASKYYGQKVIKNNLVDPKYFAMETWSSTYTKNSPMGDQPLEAFSNKSIGLLNTAGAGKSYTDVYIFRLAETYLLRAEAYLAKGDKEKAAADINVIRSRSHASPVSPSNVDLDYILDERAREFMWEELRRLTLQRTGKLVERVKKYNRLAKGTIKDFNNLWPIPFSEIEKNTEAKLEQNPDY